MNTIPAMSGRVTQLACPCGEQLKDAQNTTEFSELSARLMQIEFRNVISRLRKEQGNLRESENKSAKGNIETRKQMITVIVI